MNALSMNAIGTEIGFLLRLNHQLANRPLDLFGTILTGLHRLPWARVQAIESSCGLRRCATLRRLD